MLQDGIRVLGSPLGAGYYEGLEELLIAADLGVPLAVKLSAAVRAGRPQSESQAQSLLEAAVVTVMSARPRDLVLPNTLACILLCGVNGAGKTTTIGKLAHRLKRSGRRPMVIAADTYRAAAAEQVRVWAERAGVPCFAGAAGGDPGAVVFDGLAMAQSRGLDVALVDTAGRLQTHHNLVEELSKVGRVAGRAVAGAPHESLLVLDAMLGQSNLAQARGFSKALALTGLVMAKLDGSSKGGAALAIEQELGLPTKLVGVGEEIEDLAAFDPPAFARSIFGA